MNRLLKILKKGLVLMLPVVTACIPVNAAGRGEVARNAYAFKLSRPKIENESTASFRFQRPVDLNGDGVSELIVSQLTSRPVIYAFHHGAPHIVYKGNGDGAVMQYFPEIGVFVEVSGRMGEYRVWYVRYNGEKTRVLFSYAYEGEPMSPNGRDYIFTHYKTSWFQGNSWTGEKISRWKFEELYEKTIGDAAWIPVSSTSYTNTAENRQKYIIESPVSTEADADPESGNLSGKTGGTEIPAPVIVRCEEIPEGMSYVEWSEVPEATGYLVEYAADPGFKGSMTEKRAGEGQNWFTGENLEAGKTYYYRVQAYKRADGMISRSEWSEVGEMVAVE